VWFDTGTHLVCDYSISEKYLAPLSDLGKFIHDYRKRNKHWMTLTKGFFDMGDIVWMIDPSTCKSEVVRAPYMNEYMYFEPARSMGKMLRIFDIDNDRSWNLLFQRMATFYQK
jgi:hypothetical protein